MPGVKGRKKQTPRKPRPKPAAPTKAESGRRGGNPTGSLENSRLRLELEAAHAALAAAHNEIREGGEQQAALAEILRAISTSPGNLEPVLESLVESAARFCGAEDASIFHIDGNSLRLAAHHGHVPGSAEDVRIPIVRGTVGGRSVLDRRPVHVADVPSETEEFPEGSLISRRVGHRTILSVPLLVRGVPVGVIQLRRADVRPFTEKQIELLKTFADQAVIAIENVRLFRELAMRNAQLTESLDRQTATSEILSAISRSPTDLQPVLNTVVDSASRLCGAANVSLFRVQGDEMRKVAEHESGPQLTSLPVGGTRTITRGSVSGRAIVDCTTIRVEDQQAPEVANEFPDGARRDTGIRSTVGIPLVRDGRAIGAFTVYRTEYRPFSDSEVELLQSFADQALIAIENVRLFTELQASNRDLTAALDRQTATSEILRVINRSQTDAQPVFQAIVESAVRLLRAYAGALARFDGHSMHLMAGTSTDAAGDAALREFFPRPLSQAPLHANAIRDGVPQIVADATSDPRLPESVHAYARVRGYRSQIVVPVGRNSATVGTLSIVGREEFSSEAVALLEMFADQAVIAIENVRLFTELQERNRALTEALDQQTATGDILRVISSALTDIQPVLDAVAQNSARLCEASDAVIQLREPDDHLRIAAHFGEIPAPMGMRRPLGRGWVAGRSVLDAQPIHLADLQAEEAEYPEGTAIARAAGHRSILAMPLVREGEAIGVIQVRRLEVRPFSEKHISLLRTFADQAVIALENVRLFTELQTSNRELTAALDTQTATSEILRVISRSQTDVQPVFDAIVHSAVRLLRGYGGSLVRIRGDQIELVALTHTDAAGDAAVSATYPRSIYSEEPLARAIRNRAPFNFADVENDPRVPEAGRTFARLRGYRTLAFVPLLRDDDVLGGITVSRRAPGGFTPDEIALLKTFADQAVIAIGNARLLTELQARTDDLTRSVEQLTALGEVGRAVSSSLDLDTVLNTIVARAVQLSGTDGGTIFEYDETAEEFTARATLNASERQSALLRGTRLRRGEGAVGRMAVTREPFQIPDITTEGAYASRIRGAMLESGTRSVLAVPLLHEQRIVGGLVVTRRVPGEFSPAVIEILRTFAIQSALAIQNARLFSQLEIKSRELEVASQHKSEFLASMSHELRTPLNAIIGFSDVLLQGMFGDTNEKQEEYLRDILSSGQHLLSLINDILDLSKIEAGRMDLELTEFHAPTAIDNAIMLMRERAARRGQTLERAVAPALGEIRADERTFKQVLLNLLSNAVTFTGEGGRITVSAGLANGEAVVSVKDTGIGIAPEHHALVFEEFRQVGHADKKAEGTGLGLALCRKFIELHGGRISLASELGKGSTFTFALPVGGPPPAS